MCHLGRAEGCRLLVLTKQGLSPSAGPLSSLDPNLVLLLMPYNCSPAHPASSQSRKMWVSFWKCYQPGSATWSSVTLCQPFPLCMPLSSAVESSFQPLPLFVLLRREADKAQGRESRYKISLCKEQKFHPSILVKAQKSGYDSHISQMPIFQEEEEGTFARVR